MASCLEPSPSPVPPVVIEEAPANDSIQEIDDEMITDDEDEDNGEDDQMEIKGLLCKSVVPVVISFLGPRRFSYPIKYKLNVLEKLRTQFDENISKCARHFKLTRTHIQRWKKEDAEGKYDQVSESRQHSVVRVRHSHMNPETIKNRGRWPDVDTKVFDWVKAERKEGYQVHGKDIIDQAVKVFAELHPNEGLSCKPVLPVVICLFSFLRFARMAD